jgi:hypothetical protein
VGPVRMPGSTRQATRDELRALFAERWPAQPAADPWDLRAPEIPRARTARRTPPWISSCARASSCQPGLRAGVGRSLSERSGTWQGGLDRSALAEALLRLTHFADAGVESFHPEGGANRSHTATLIWRLEQRDPVAFEMTARIEVPGH